MKKFLIGLLILILLPILGMAIFLLTFNLNRYRGLVESELSKSLNHPVQIASLETKLALVPTIQIKDFKVLTRQKDKAILTVPSMEATIEVAPLIKKRLIVQKIDIPEITFDSTYIEKKKETKPVEAKDIKADTTNTLPNEKKNLSSVLWIENIQINKMLFLFQNGDKKESFTVEKFNIKKMATFEMNFTFLKSQYTLNGNMGTLTELLGSKNTLPIDLRIKNKSNTITLKGQIGDLSQMSKIRLDLTAQFPKLSEFLTLFEMKDMPLLAIDTSVKFSAEGNLNKIVIKKININGGKNTLTLQGEGTLENVKKSPLLTLNLTTNLTSGVFSKRLGLNPFELKNKIKLHEKKIEINEIKFLSNKSDITGNIVLDFNQKPMEAQINLNSFYLSLSDILYLKKEKTTTKKNEEIKPNTTKKIPEIKIPWDILKAFNLNGQIQVVNFNVSKDISEYSSLNIQPILENGVLTSPIQMRLLSGTLNSKLLLNQENETIQLKVQAKDIDLDRVRPLNKEIQNAIFISDISLQTKGNTTKELLLNSSGNFVMEIVGGQIISQFFNDLVESLDTTHASAFATTQQQTNILCGVVNLNLDKGILTSKNQVVLQTEPLNLVLNGQVNLNAETMDISLLPSQPNASQLESALMEMVQVITLSGPWTDIQVGLDSQKVLSNLLDTGLNVALKPKEKSPTALCEKALGRAVSKVVKKPKVEAKPMIQPAPKKHKANFKEQLLQSLSKILSKKAN